MKKIKFLLCAVAVVVAFSISNVLGLTSKDRANIMKQQLENYHFDFKYVDMSDNYKLIKEHQKLDMWRSLEKVFLNGLVRSELENIIDFEPNDGIDMNCYLAGEEVTYGDPDTGLSKTETKENDGCILSIYTNNKDYTDQANFTIEVLANFEQVKGDSKTKKEAKKIIEQIVDNVYVADADMLNHYVNYKSNSSTFFAGKNALLEFSNLKKAVEDYPEYEFFVGYEDTRRGAAYVSFAEGSTYVAKDGIVYGFTYNTYTSANMFFVPVGTEFSKYGEVLEKRLKEYVNDDSVNIKVLPYDATIENFLPTPNADVSYTFQNNLNIDIEDYYKKVGSSSAKERDKLNDRYCELETCVAMQSYQLFINGERYEIGITEMDPETLNKFGTVLSKDSKTGIILKTSAGNVPLDAKLIVETFKLSDAEKKLLESHGYTSIESYNFQLYSILLKKAISKFNDVTHVLIPFNDKWDKNLKIIYLSDDLKTIEYYEPEVVMYEGNKYLQFETKHFSNYILTEYKLDNPNTGDNIKLYIGLGIVSMISLFVLVLLKKKSNRHN